MGARRFIDDQMWEKIEPLLPAKTTRRGRPKEDTRLILEGIVWVMRTGAPWRDMPDEFGPWQTCYTRLRRWSEQGVWEKMFSVLKKESDTQEYMIDATIVKAHPHAAGCLIAEQENEALGRSKGGFTTKIHAVVDGLGLPVDVRLTGGNRNDITQAEELMKDKTPQKLIADKGYDSDAFRNMLDGKGIETVIPPREKRSKPASYDKAVYTERHLIENFFLKIKFFRGIATRYCKTASIFLNLVKIACILARVRI